MLTRNVGFCDPIEGLEVRSKLTCNILQALVKYPHAYSQMVPIEGGDVRKWRERIGMFDVFRRMIVVVSMHQGLSMVT